MIDLAVLEKSMHYVFSKRSLLRTALTHPSYATPHNQRMEYLGDSLLNFIISQVLYTKHASSSEGVLTRLRANLVCKRTLAVMARNMQLNDYMLVGKSFDQCDFTDGMYADVFEAIVAALYLDGGYAAAEKTVVFCYENFLSKDYADFVQKDPKTTLQEFCQKHHYALPDYHVQEVKADPAHRFHVKASVAAIGLESIAHAATKREGQQRAAQGIVSQLQQKGILEYD